jgi:hypothetical protein
MIQSTERKLKGRVMLSQKKTMCLMLVERQVLFFVLTVGRTILSVAHSGGQDCPSYPKLKTVAVLILR